MRRVLPAVLAGAAMWLCNEAFAAAAVFGSFQARGNAERFCTELVRHPELGVRVVAVESDRGRLYRVISQSGDEGETRALMARARALGITAVWYWADAPDPEPTMEQVAERMPAAPQAPAPSEDPADIPTVPQPAPTVAAQPEEEGTPPAPGRDLRLQAAGEAIVVPRIEGAAITMDGRLDEAIWNDIPGHDDMVVVEPDTLTPPRFRTVNRFFYTDRGLYVGVWNEQPPDTLIARLSSRDDYINRDSWTLTLDTSGEGLYGYWFSVNLGGTVGDGKVAPERNYSREWDGPWDSATAELDDGWSTELFLPWSMMSMPRTAGDRVMGIFASRKVAHLDERWGWPALPRTVARFMSALQPMSLPGVVPKEQLEAYPYIGAAVDAADGDETFNAGVDVFWRPSSNFQVTAAALPDFGAVETDDVVINLTARETYFPEKRLFFLEGSEIFATSGRSATPRPGGASSGSGMRADDSGSRRTMSSFQRTPSSVLNTRRIGGAPVIEYADDLDVAPHRLSQPTDLLGAAKITGQTGGVRYGVLTAFEDEPVLKATMTDSLGMDQDVHVRGDGRNFGVVRALYENVGDGRQAYGYIGTHVDHPLRSATVHGLDAQYLSPGGKILAELQALTSDVRCTASLEGMARTRKCDEGMDDSQQGYGGWADFYYTQARGMQHGVRLDFVDENLDINDVGFLERNSNFGGFYSFTMIRPDVFGLRRMTTMFSIANWDNAEGQNTRTGSFFLNTFTFKNRNELRTALRYFPRRWEDLESRGNGVFRIDKRYNVELAFGTDTSRPIAWSAQAVALSEDLGGMSYTAALGVTLKPLDRFSLDVDLQYMDRDGWLRYVWNEADFATFEASDLQPRVAVDYFLSARQQLRLTMQWAGIRAEEQELWQIIEGEDELQPRTRLEGEANDDFTISQLTMQLRYRWQIAPLSDLFVVYNRGSNLANAYDLDDPFARPRDGFGELYRDAFTDPLVDMLVVKLRYRLGG